MLVYSSGVDVSSSALHFLAARLRERRRTLGTRWRRLSAGRQSLLTLAHLRNGQPYAQLAAGFGVGTTTVYRYVNEAVELLAALAPTLAEAVRAASIQRRTITPTPAESAMAWLHSRLARVPFADVSMTGLLLHCPHEERGPDAFDSVVDTELARHGMPVLGRLPHPPRRSPHRTVLDHLPAEQRAGAWSTRASA